MKQIGSARSINLRFVHAISSGFLTGAIGVWSLSGSVDKVTTLNFNLGMSLRWTSGSMMGVGIIVGIVVTLVLNFFFPSD
jgi:hypothetical protein